TAERMVRRPCRPGPRPAGPTGRPHRRGTPGHRRCTGPSAGCLPCWQCTTARRHTPAELVWASAHDQFQTAPGASLLSSESDTNCGTQRLELRTQTMALVQAAVLQQPELAPVHQCPGLSERQVEQLLDSENDLMAAGASGHEE